MQAFLLFNNQVSKLTSDLKLEDGVKTLLTTQAEAKIFELSLSRLLEPTMPMCGKVKVNYLFII